MTLPLRPLLSLLLSLLATPAWALGLNAPIEPENPKILGWAEPVVLLPQGSHMFAKLDTGARTSSIRAGMIQSFFKDGKEWVRFTLPDEAEPRTTYEHPIRRWADIKEMDGNLQRRPVVEMSLCLDNAMLRGDVTLAPRSHMLYPVLIGRNMLKRFALVHSGLEDSSVPNCVPAETPPIAPAAAPTAVPDAPVPLIPAAPPKPPQQVFAPADPTDLTIIEPAAGPVDPAPLPALPEFLPAAQPASFPREWQ